VRRDAFETATRRASQGAEGSLAATLSRYRPQVVVSFLVLVMLLGGAFYAARLSEGAPRVVYSASLEEAEDDSQDSLAVNINTADAAELDELPEVGPATAEAIVEHRRNSGLFRSVDELVSVQNSKHLEGLTFHVLLPEDGAGRLEMTRA
jgi:competence protein ComEA